MAGAYRGEDSGSACGVGTVGSLIVGTLIGGTLTRGSSTSGSGLQMARSDGSARRTVATAATVATSSSGSNGFVT